MQKIGLEEDVAGQKKVAAGFWRGKVTAWVQKAMAVSELVPILPLIIWATN